MNAELSHESLSQLLSWYANSTLSPEERAQVETHLASCAACRSELDWLQGVSAAMAEIAEEAPTVAPSFAKVLASVDEWERSKVAPAASPAREVHSSPELKADGGSWLARWFDALWNPPAPVARFALAASFALVIGLGVYIAIPHQNPPAFTTLSGSEAPVSGAVLSVSFAPETTVEQVGQILKGVGGRIVSGPSANGIYAVELPVKPDRRAEIQTAIEKLRGNQAIRFVERQP